LTGGGLFEPKSFATSGASNDDMKALSDLLVRIRHLMSHRPGIKEMDLNPGRVHEKGVRVSDALMLVD
jgi:hypothetical protein